VIEGLRGQRETAGSVEAGKGEELGREGGREEGREEGKEGGKMSVWYG